MLHIYILFHNIRNRWEKTVRVESKLKMEKWSLKKVSEKLVFKFGVGLGGWGVGV